MFGQCSANLTCTQNNNLHGFGFPPDKVVQTLNPKADIFMGNFTAILRLVGAFGGQASEKEPIATMHLRQHLITVFGFDGARNIQAHRFAVF